MKKLPLMALALLAFGANNAAAQDVRYDFAKDAPFSDYKSYKWVDIKGSDKVNELAQQQIKAALQAELATKGLTKTDSDDADLYIGDQTAIGTEKQFNSYSTGWGMGPGLGRRMVWWWWHDNNHRLDQHDLYRPVSVGHV